MSVIRVVLVSGSRSWQNREVVERVIGRVVAGVGTQRLLVVHGGAPGLDLLAGNVCKDLGIHTAAVPALWEHYHNAAGPMRNSIMLALNPALVIGFHWDLNESKGTKDMLLKAHKAGIKHKLIKVSRHAAVTPPRVREGKK